MHIFGCLLSPGLRRGSDCRWRGSWLSLLAAMAAVAPVASAGQPAGSAPAAGVDRSARPRRLGLAVVLAVMALGLVLAASARAENCQPGPNGSPGDYAYNGACGPEFESPGWGDGAGWRSPSQYSTIKLADITGNGQDELLARNSDGLEIWRFDTSIGQWRPAIGADGLPEVLRDFRSPLPNESPDSHGTDPMVYSTLQAAQVLGNGTESIVAQFPDGTHTYDYVPPAGTKNIDGGKWLEEPVSGPTGDRPPSEYLNMRVIPVQPGVTPATLVFQYSYYVHSGPGTPGGGSWAATGTTTLAPPTTAPGYYLDNRSALWPVEGAGSAGPQLRPVDIYRTKNGIGWQIYDPGKNFCPRYGGCAANATWSGEPSAFGGAVGPFPDTDSVQYGCVTENFNCFGTSPDFYETLRTANDLRGPGDNDGYVLGRLSNGLHVYASSYGSDWDTSIPVLTALKDPDSAPYTPPPGTWSSIRTGDITGDGRTDVLAVVNGQLEAWELKPNGSGGWAWSQLPAAVPLNLGQSFEDNASYYSTIQVGPVAGSGYPDGVIARGPFGVRTWFYCSGGASPVPGCASLQGQSGWTSFLPQDTSSYPQFTGAQAAAWTQLNAMAAADNLIGPNTTVRSVWTGPDAPTDTQLDNLSNGLLVGAKCSGETSANPPTYASCTPPAGSSGFGVPDWTAVVNETFREIYDARQVLSYFDQLNNIRQDAFLTNTATLPAIGSELQPLNGAAATPVSISPWAAESAGIGIAGAFAGAAVVPPFGPAAGVILAAASYAIGLISSGTPAVQAPPFFGTYADLQSRFATAAAQADKTLEVQGGEVRQNWNEMQLITQLTAPGGPWNKMDGTGLESSMEEGLTLWAYQTLLPTLYDRYVITGCRGEKEVPGNTDCFFSNWGPVTMTNGSATTLQAPPSGNWDSGANGGGGTPCYWHWFFHYIRCDYTSPPTSNGANGQDLATQVWGAVSNACNYNGSPLTKWTFGCSLGVPAQYSIDQAGDAYGWAFTTCTGNPVVSAPDGRDTSGSAAPQGQCTTPTGSATPGSDGDMQLSATAGPPRGFDVSSATLESRGLLHATGPDAKTASSSPASPLTTIHLSIGHGRQLAGGGRELGSAPGTPPATLVLSHNSHGQPTVRFSLSRVGVAVPQACQELPASVSLTTSPFQVTTTLVLSNGHGTRTISLPSTWECVRDRAGTITTMRTIAPTPPAQRPGLRVFIRGPRTVIPGSTVSYTVELRNNRRGPRNRTMSSLWNLTTRVNLMPGRSGQPAPSVRFAAPTIVRQFRELRRGRSKTLRIVMHIPAALSETNLQQVCVTAGATADAARSAFAQTCATLAAVPTGLG